MGWKFLIAVAVHLVRNRIKACQERRPAWCANRALAISPGECNAAFRDCINVRRFRPGMAKTRERVPALLIGGDPQDIGAVF